MNIVMIGMPASGKSTVGVLLAKALGLDFVDCDLIIQKKYASSLQKLIEKHGIRGFLDIEADVLASVDMRDTVIATGGSAVYSHRAMEHLKKDALTVYIKLPYDEIERRLTNIKTRGIAMEKGTTLSDIYAERTPLYERYADITLDASGFDIEKTVEEAATLLREHASWSDECRKYIL